MSLSRLHHWLPRRPAPPAVVESTAQGHHEVTDARRPALAPLLHAAPALDTAMDGLQPSAALGAGVLGPWRLQGARLTAGGLGRHAERHLRPRAGEAAG